MAVNTKTVLRNQIIYSVFVRNHTEEGTFEALEKDLQRIRSLGADIIWLLPIHPIGRKNRKGELGSPYAISDYRGINPEYGTPESFLSLVDRIHELGMKCMIDVVYSHTSPDSVLAQKHPDWFYRKADGSFGNKTADWTDVIDLDYSNKDLWNYQIETLKYWSGIVDGFRCDVAPLVPIEFWKEAREAVALVRPDCIWLTESVHPDFIVENRNRGYIAHSDCEMYQAFDITYDYDIRTVFEGYIAGDASLEEYIKAIYRQESLYPANYCKLRFLENHDMPRIYSLITDQRKIVNWTVFYFLLKGAAFIYAGQEFCIRHTPDLFDRDTIVWNKEADISEVLRKLAGIKKDVLLADGVFSIKAEGDRETVILEYRDANARLFVIACLDAEKTKVQPGIPDGEYQDMLSGEAYVINQGKLQLNGLPVILRLEAGGQHGTEQ